MDVLETVVEDARKVGTTSHDHIEALVRGILARSPSQRAIIRVARQEMENLSPEGKQALREAYHHKFVGKITQLIIEGIDAAELIPADPKMLTWALLGLINPYLYPTHNGGKRVSDEIVSNVLNIFFYGVTPR